MVCLTLGFGIFHEVKRAGPGELFSHLQHLLHTSCTPAAHLLPRAHREERSRVFQEQPSSQPRWEGELRRSSSARQQQQISAACERGCTGGGPRKTAAFHCISYREGWSGREPPYAAREGRPQGRWEALPPAVGPAGPCGPIRMEAVIVSARAGGPGRPLEQRRRCCAPRPPRSERARLCRARLNRAAAGPCTHASPSPVWTGRHRVEYTEEDPKPQLEEACKVECLKEWHNYKVRFCLAFIWRAEHERC